MLRSQRLIALSIGVAIASLASAQTVLPPPPHHPPRKPATRPAAPVTHGPGRRAAPAVRRPLRPDLPQAHRAAPAVGPTYHRGPSPAASEPANESVPASGEAHRHIRELTLSTSRLAREPQVVELEITSSEGEPWGRILIELYPERTPITTRTFLKYVNDGYYDGTIFHRVIPGFIIQGGGYTGLNELKTEGLGEPLRNESRRGAMRNGRGMVAMAHKKDPHSAQSQFFINLASNEQLDCPRAGAYGYCVFGKVVEGMDVVDRIAAVPTRVSEAAQRRYEHYIREGRPVEKVEQSEPLDPPVLKHARLLDPSEIPPSALTGPGGRHAQSKVEPPPPVTQPAAEAEEQPGEESAEEPAVEPEPAPETAPADVEPEPEPDESTSQERAHNIRTGRAHPAKRAVGPKADR